MVASLKASTYLVDGVDLETTGVELTHDGAGLWTGLSEDVVVSTFPGTDGGAIGGGSFHPYTHSTMFLVRGTGFDSVWAAIVALRRRCKPGQTVTLTRQMPDPDGGGSNTNQTTTARRQTDRVSWITDIAAAVDIDWLIADTPWHGAAVAISSAAGTTSVAGDLSTHRMTLTLAAGAARTITNTTNGHAFTFSTTVPSGGVLVDVEARTATGITGSVDMSAYLSWTKAYPMRLNAGSNTLTVSAGTASISYQPAYL
jgi:hypothetical protein